jgi:hypothetical protein
VSRDPRLRLLAGSTDATVAGEVLRALDDVVVVVRCGPDVTGPSTTAAAAFIGMAARLFGDVRLEPRLLLGPNWWDATDAASLLSGIDALRPRPEVPATRLLVVTFGLAVGGDWGVGGGDYTVRLGRGPQPVDSGQHALGVHAAASLMISQLLLHVLAPWGFHGVPVHDDYVMNLIDFATSPTPTDVRPAPAEALALAAAGAGSVGSSALALLAGAVAPGVGAHGPVPTCIDVIDGDVLDRGRNPYRYPALVGTEAGAKASWLVARLRAVGLTAQAHVGPVADWVRNRPTPGFDGLLLSSVDTLDGRADVTDALARQTLSLGVDGLRLHAQREGFADDYACPFCDFVSVAPALTQAGVYSQITTLPLPRILALLQPTARLTLQDVDMAVASGRLHPDRREQLIGAALTDLFRQAYAEAPLQAAGTSADVIAVAAPQVSWFAGVLGAVEVVKQLHGLPLLDRRVDVDVTGLPPGLVRRAPADTTGRCLCRSGTRRSWHQRLFPTTPTSDVL